MAESSKKNSSQRVVLSEPGDLIAAVPHLFGFRPERSLVVLADAVRGKKIERCLRCDLPSVDQIELCARSVVQAITAGRLSSVVVIVVGDGEDPLTYPPPHTSLLAAVRRELDARRVEVTDALWVPAIEQGARWQCYDHEEHSGVLPDPKGSVIAAYAAREGHVAYDTREEMAQLFAPDADPLRARRGILIDGLLDDDGWSPKRGADAVRRGLRAAGSTILALSDDLIAELGLAVTDVRVRDACLATARPADDELAASAERLWQALTRSLPDPERAEAACLAGFAAYCRGDGALASIALQLALEVCPSHVLAGLLYRALGANLPPEQIRGLAEHDEIGLCAQLRTAA